MTTGSLSIASARHLFAPKLVEGNVTATSLAHLDLPVTALDSHHIWLAQGCVRLSASQIFALASAADSFDSRYIGSEDLHLDVPGIIDAVLEKDAGILEAALCQPVSYAATSAAAHETDVATARRRLENRALHS